MDPTQHVCKSFHLREMTEFDATHILNSPFPVTLHGGVEEKLCLDCGANNGHIVREPDKLIAVAAVMRACNDIKLNGREVRFLRRSLGLKAKELSNEMGLTASHLSKIENDKVAISEVYEKLLRTTVCLRFLDAAVSLGVQGSTIISMKIKPARCASKSFYLDLCMVERKSNLVEIKGGESLSKTISAAWRDDTEVLIAM